MKRATFLPLTVVSALLLLTSAFAAAPNAPQGKSDDKSPAGGTDSAEQEKREKAFAEKLTGATLVGHFTVNGRQGQPGEERYEITSVKKLAGEMWVITARVKYGQRDVTVPIPLPVRWAGDTPVVCLTDLTIPNLGTYTARVLFYGDQYAGTWSAGGGADHGGHLWGRIEKAGANAAPKATGEKAGAGGANAK